jgi:hypothetical protein
MSFVKQTLKELGIDQAANTLTVWMAPDGRFPDKKEERHYEIFTADEHDNLVIAYIRLDGRPYDFRREGNKWPSPFVRTRHKVPLKGENGEQIRYTSPKGSGMNPFFPPAIIRKYQAGEKIETLIVTEGEKKAFKACMHGFDCVGIPSIHGFYDSGEIRGRLHEDLQELIIRCEVKTIVYLTDADTRLIKYEKDKDLSKRQSSFYTAINLFRNSLNLIYDSEETELCRVYFAQIDEKYYETGKGLDDLLVNHSSEIDDIRNDIGQLDFAKRYFHLINISDGKLQKVYGYLGLKDEQEFYSIYKKHIGSREFLFKGRRYEYDGEKVRYVRHEDADKFMRIGADWLKIIKRPNKHGDLIEEIIPFKISEIQRDYKKYPDFIENVPKFDSFCSEPCWDDKYKRVHYGCYNIFSPIPHVPQQGKWDTIYNFLKHLFRGEGCIDDRGEHGKLGDIFTVALDYLTIMYRYPKQMLPVLILVSRENVTGKSTFLKFLDAIYSGNTAILNNELFKMKFNSHYITKFIIAIDEGFLDVDKKAEKERIKQLATADTAYLENKGMNIKSFPYYGKLILSSNDADNVMKIEETDTRWFIVKVPPIEGTRDPDMEQKLKEEIPAFLHYLATRNIFHPRQDRLWFKTEYFLTEQFRIIMEATRNMTEKILNDLMQELFVTYQINNMKIDLAWLTKALNQESKYRISKMEIKKIMEARGYKLEMSRVRIPIGFNEMGGADVVNFENYPARCYDLNAKDWVKEGQINQPVEAGAAGTNEDLPF